MAMKIYVCNLATQPGETDHYTCGDHIRAIETHVDGALFDVILANNRFEGKIKQRTGKSEWVITEAGLNEHYPIYSADLVNAEYPWRHDPNKLAQVVMDIFSERTGPLAEKN
jgi:2-phospho-L-lactate transferase/gluconeogenesis factor (CofD/UPF0052 family)